MFIKWTYPEYFNLLSNGAWGCFEELACEQALLFGRASRERLSEGLPLTASPLACAFSQDPLRDKPNRRACSQAIEEQKSYLDHIKILIVWLAPATLDIFLKGLPCNLFSTFNFLFEIVSKSEFFGNHFFNLFLRFYVDEQLCLDNVVKPFTMWSMLEFCSNNIAQQENSNSSFYTT